VYEDQNLQREQLVLLSCTKHSDVLAGAWLPWLLAWLTLTGPVPAVSRKAAEVQVAGRILLPHSHAGAVSRVVACPLVRCHGVASSKGPAHRKGGW
jgi:hypothetical protein